MKYTNAELIKRVEEAKKNKRDLTHITDKTQLSIEDKFKLSLCKHFVQYVNNKRAKLNAISEMIKIPSTRLSEMANYKINKFTVDQLLKNLSALAQHDSQTKAYLDLVEQAVGTPTLKVADTKKLTRTLREGSRSLQLHQAHA